MSHEGDPHSQIPEEPLPDAERVAHYLMRVLDGTLQAAVKERVEAGRLLRVISLKARIGDTSPQNRIEVTRRDNEICGILRAIALDPLYSHDVRLDAAAVSL